MSFALDPHRLHTMNSGTRSPSLSELYHITVQFPVAGSSPRALAVSEIFLGEPSALFFLEGQPTRAYDEHDYDHDMNSDCINEKKVGCFFDKLI